MSSTGNGYADYNRVKPAISVQQITPATPVRSMGHMAPEKGWIEIPLKDQDAKPIPIESYHITVPTRSIKKIRSIRKASSSFMPRFAGSHAI